MVNFVCSELNILSKFHLHLTFLHRKVPSHYRDSSFKTKTRITSILSSSNSLPPSPSPSSTHSSNSISSTSVSSRTKKCHRLLVKRHLYSSRAQTNCSDVAKQRQLCPSCSIPSPIIQPTQDSLAHFAILLTHFAII